MPSFLLLASWKSPLRNGDVHYPFRVDSDFLAWTHMDIEGAILLKTLPDGEEILFFDEPTEFERLWESIRWDTTSIRASGFTWAILPRSELEKTISGRDEEFLLPDHTVASTESEYRFLRAILEGKQVSSADRYLIQKRLIKSPEDIEKIKKVIDLTEKTYRYITENVRPGMYEYEIEAMIAYQFRLYRWIEAFPTIVASWLKGCTLHYTALDRQIGEGDLILIDFGIEFDGYGADISRTFPVSGVFTPRQQEIHDAVMEVKHFAESILKPGITRKEWNIAVKEYMYSVCQRLRLPNITEFNALSNPYFPHSIGHFLGLDTHDIGDTNLPLAPGMIMTIEPGIYIREEWIGIREEDDYLIVESGCVRL